MNTETVPVRSAHPPRRPGTTTPVATATLDPTSWALNGLSYGNGASTLYTYGADQARLATLSHYESGGGAPKVQWTYAYDGAGRLTGDSEDSYRYDTLGRLTQALVQRLDGAGSVTQDFLYDAFGNTTPAWRRGLCRPPPRRATTSTTSR